MTSLKQKTISGILWSFIENFSRLGITFIIGIIMARLLSPREFGLIGMITVFVALSNSLVDSGFTQALIRKKNCTQDDYSTVFYFNLFAGFLLYGILYLFAPGISAFYNEPRLTPIIRLQGVIVLINALTLIQRTILVKRVDFKLQTKISIVASILAGITGITLAYKGYGVWSLVWNAILVSALTSLLLWIFNRWRPVLRFSLDHLKEHFHFGYKLLLSGLLNTAWKNIYMLVIGKFFATETLGFYTRADMFKKVPSQNITTVISRVSYPVLSQLQDDPKRLKFGYHKLIVCSTLVTFVLMLGMAAVAEPMILLLLGDPWRESIWMLQVICFAGMLYPLHALNLNMLKVQGRSDLFLRLEIYKKILALPVIVLGVLFGMRVLLLGMVVNSFIAYTLNSYWSGKLLNYSIMAQLKDIIPSFLLAGGVSALVYILGILLPYDHLPKLLLQVSTGTLLTVALCELFRLEPYLIMKEIVLSKLALRFNPS